MKKIPLGQYESMWFNKSVQYLYDKMPDMCDCVSVGACLFLYTVSMHVSQPFLLLSSCW